MTCINQDNIKKIWCEVLRIGQVEEEVDYLSLGFHSVFMLQILNKINEHYSINLTVPEFAQHQSIKKLSELVTDKINTAALKA